ncbi:MAG: HAMP domain-containing histidine kinase [Thiotrichales bacterium]|nr:HAMP domain-containing histidine kinase [Thiotrichales bacterium]
MSGAELTGWLVLSLLLFLTAAFSGYYLRRTRQLSHALTELHQLNQQVEHDALQFYRHAWAILHQVGVYTIAAKIKWFGEEKTIQFGELPTQKSVLLYQQIDHGEMALDIVLQVSRRAARAGTLANLVLETFFAILERDLMLKEHQVSATQKRLERYQLFVQHEIKNIAQFIDLLNAQVVKIERDEDKIRLADRLKKTLPVMAERAQKTIQSMKNPTFNPQARQHFALEALVQQVIQMYGLNCKLLGQALIQTDRELFLEVLKNVLGNFRDHQSESDLTIFIKDNPRPNQVEIQIHSRKVPGVSLQPERMFEPFWTTSHSGLGLGLFLARELLKKIDGEIQFQQTTQHFGFIIRLPKTVD